MKSTIKKYSLIAVVVGLMLAVTYRILTTISTIKDVAIANFLSLVLNYIFISGPVVAIIICTGIIVSKLEEKNKKDEK